MIKFSQARLIGIEEKQQNLKRSQDPAELNGIETVAKTHAIPLELFIPWPVAEELCSPWPNDYTHIHIHRHPDRRTNTHTHISAVANQALVPTKEECVV